MHTEIAFKNVAAVCARLGVSRQTLYRLLKTEGFPQPCYPGGIKSPRWRSDHIAAWIDRESSPTAA